MIFEWQAGLWQRVLDSAGRMPHALLFAGPAGGGKRHFAEALAARGWRVLTASEYLAEFNKGVKFAEERRKALADFDREFLK